MGKMLRERHYIGDFNKGNMRAQSSNENSLNSIMTVELLPPPTAVGWRRLFFDLIAESLLCFSPSLTAVLLGKIRYFEINQVIIWTGKVMMAIINHIKPP